MKQTLKSIKNLVIFGLTFGTIVALIYMLYRFLFVADWFTTEALFTALRYGIRVAIAGPLIVIGLAALMTIKRDDNDSTPPGFTY